MKVYIASRFERKDEMKSLSKILPGFGIHVQSRWLDETISPTSQLSDITPVYAKEQAGYDLEDIDSVDTLLFFADPVPLTVRGGKHVEFGYALAKGKRIIVVGGNDNIFHYLDNIVHYLTVEDFIDAEGVTSGVTN